jgi:mycoredoxin-dependent peroxiredoxin
MPVEVDDAAPDFTLVDQHGGPVRLADYRGRKNVVLIFYPLAFSRVCSGELCEIRDALATLGPEEDVQVLTVSVDSMFAHRVWSEQEGYRFPLLSDFWPHGEVAKSYGVFDETKGVAVRGTFVIDRAGIVRWKVVHAIPDARDIDEYRKALAAL